MRLYWPKIEAPSILPAGEGTWKPPAIAAARSHVRPAAIANRDGGRIYSESAHCFHTQM